MARSERERMPPPSRRPLRLSDDGRRPRVEPMVARHNAAPEPDLTAVVTPHTPTRRAARRPRRNRGRFQ